MSGGNVDFDSEWSGAPMSGGIFNEPTDPEKAVIDELDPWITSGQVRVLTGNQEFFDLMEAKYPVGLNRIDWSGVPRHRVKDVLPLRRADLSRAEHIDILTQYGELMASWFRAEGVNLERECVWVGDSCDIHVLMDCNTLLSAFSFLFSLATVQQDETVREVCFSSDGRAVAFIASSGGQSLVQDAKGSRTRYTTSQKISSLAMTGKPPSTTPGLVRSA